MNSTATAEGGVGQHAGEADDGAGGDALAAAALAHESDELARSHVEGHAIDSVHRAFL